jgi:ectoine hydroxylase-related dioxygenase (phytanoyl-CoA dioxygenase family)
MSNDFQQSLSDEQVAYYRSNGFLTVDNVLSPAELAELRSVTDDMVEQSRAVDANTALYDLEPGHSAVQPRVRRLKNPAGHHPAYDRLMRHERILDIVAQLIGQAMWSNGNKLNMKSAEFGSPIEWHQDWAFYPQTNDDLLAVGVPLDDMLLENGCMLMTPGSHTGPLYDHHQEGVFIGAINDPRFKPEQEEVVPIQVKAGGISIHHARTLHASAPNRSNKSRRLMLIQYCAGDAWPLMGVASWDAHRATFVRGEPATAPRMTAVPVRIPLPTRMPGGTIYELQTQLKTSAFGGRK